MTIGELAGRFGLAAHVLRHWEDAGLLIPGRDAAGHRRYGPGDAETVTMILLGKEAGLSLEQIRRLFDGAPDRATRHRFLREHEAGLRDRIARLQASLDVIEHALDCPAEDFRACPHFRAKLAAAAPAVAQAAGG